MCYSKFKSFNFSNHFKFIILKTENSYTIYLYSNLYYIKIHSFLIKSYLYFDKQTLSVYFKNTTKVPIFYNLFYDYLLKMLYKFLMLSFNCVKYSGKGYRVYIKKLNFLYFQLGYSHKLYLNNFKLLFNGNIKNNIIIFGNYVISINNFTKKIINLRQINTYTLRGIRYNKQIIYKKLGKVSTYK